MNIVLFSTYELGHQPFNLAHPLAVLRAAGFKAHAVDLALDRFEPAVLEEVSLVAFSIPMHTAARLTVDLLSKIRNSYPTIHIAAYGLYAVMNRDYFSQVGVNSIIDGDPESGLLALGKKLKYKASKKSTEDKANKISRAEFLLPERADLPSLDRYARFQQSDGARRIAGYTEASRGCKHLCRHCPVVPVYLGRFRAVSKEIVLEDIRQQVRAGAEHITFGDPDFLNGPTHGRRIVEMMHNEFPGLTYDVTIKVEHILSHRALLPVLKETGCLLITTAVESINDDVLQLLAKGHTREDFFRLVELLDEYGLDVAPTFVPFTPWTTVEEYRDLLRVIAELGLVESVAPVQLSIRLLIPPGSLLLDLDEVVSRVKNFEKSAFMYHWDSLDPRVDRLQHKVQMLAQSSGDMERGLLFSKIWAAAHKIAGIAVPAIPNTIQRRMPAQHTEPWYCCAEPTENQYRFL